PKKLHVGDHARSLRRRGEVFLPVSSSSQKEEARFLPLAVDGATEVERFGAITARAARAIDMQGAPPFPPVATLEQRARQPVIDDRSFGDWMPMGGIQLEQTAASIGIRFYVVILLVFLSGPA